MKKVLSPVLCAMLLFLASRCVVLTTLIAFASAGHHVVSHQVHICPDAPAGFAHCMAILVFSSLTSNAVPQGLNPSDLQAAYNLPSATAGKGQTVAIVDAYDDPNAEDDLGVYRAQFGLPPCTTANGCFRKVDQNGGVSYPDPDPNWSAEISLDLDMASAICPNCHILLVEASGNGYATLGGAVNTAVRLGAQVISNSYGGTEPKTASSIEESYYKHASVAITASSGDTGYGVGFPASSRYVTAVGGTSLTRDNSARGWSETTWSNTGSGCSAFISKPAWQTDSGCSRRAVADVAAVGDPGTGVSVYDSYQRAGWLTMGGTSVAAPIIAGVYALAGNESSITYGSYPYSHTNSLFDITSGSNGTCDQTYLCNAGSGYDGPTGLGTPNGVGAF